MPKYYLLFSILIVICSPFSTSAGVDCPEKTVIKAMSSEMDSFSAVAPLDFSQLKSAGALLRSQGKRLAVLLSNGSFSTAQMADSFVLPIKKKSEFILAINFSNGPDLISPGTYTPAAGYGKPFWVTAEIKLYKAEKGVIVSLGVAEGSAVITLLDESRVCGSFDLKNRQGTSFASGEFNLPLETEK